MPSLQGPLAAWSSLLAPSVLIETLRPVGSALAVPTALDRSAWEGAEADEVTLAAVGERARALRSQPWPTPRASQFARYWLDGNRTAYEEQVFTRTQRLTFAVLTSAANPHDEAALAEVLDGVMLLAEQSTWCWPAHDDVHAVSGGVVPDVDSPFLDLGAGEVAAALAWCDHVLGDVLEARYPGTRARVQREVRTRVLDPFLDRDDWHWLGTDTPAHNWTAWICGNVLVAALALETNLERRALAVAKATAGLDRFLAVVPKDGAIDEGYGYWWAGACRALEALAVLRFATNGVLDASQVEHLRELVAFPHRMQLSPQWFASFADSPARRTTGGDGQPWHVLHQWAGFTGDAQAAAFASSGRAVGEPTFDLSAMPPGAGLGRALHAVTDAAWRGVTPQAPPLPARVWLPSTQVLVARASAGESAGLTLVIKGGHNGEAHNHLDVGALSVAVDGVPVVVDPGRATYSAATFSAQRYTEWVMQSGWHSLPQPAWNGECGTSQGVGAEFGARDVVVDHDGAGLALELGGTYPAGAVRSWRRHARLAGESLVEVADRWELAADTRGAVSYVLAGEVSLGSDEGGEFARVFPLEGARPVVLRWSGSAVRASLVERGLDDPYQRSSWGERLTRLDLVALEAGGGELIVRVEVVR